MPAHYGNNGQLTRDERVQLYGIDCDDEIVWADWTPGNRTVKDLVIQNVALVTQKVKCKLPPTKEFEIPYPEPFKLAPGMKKNIPITFSPSEHKPHIDRVQIVTKGGSFFVTVKALVQDIAIKAPTFIDFGLCPTKEKSELFIDVYNVGALRAALRWHAKPPFTVHAPADILEVGEKMRCKVEFEPQGPIGFEGLIVLRATTSEESGSALEDDGQMGKTMAAGDVLAKQYALTAQGVGKMPYLCVPGMPRAVVDFGSVYPGNRAPKTLEIVNTTPVKATFTVGAVRDNGEVEPLQPSPFSVTPESGVVEANGSFTLKFFFQSQTVKEFACRRFRISTVGGTPLTITCTAFCKPIDVRLSTRSIQFGEVQCGKSGTRTLQLHNDSDRPALFHFVDMDNARGIFWLDRRSGVIPPDSYIVVTVSFAPTSSSNYFRHLQCVVKGAAAPLSLFLLGTAYAKSSRPALLEQSHVDLFRNMQLDGVREYAEGDKKRMTRNDGEGEEEEEESRKKAPVRLLSATHCFLEAMLPMDSKLRDISISPAELDFGACSTVTMSEKQVITLTNHTSLEVSVCWLTPGETRAPCYPAEKPLFAIYPPACEVKPKGQQDFVVTFRPQSESSYEGGFLEVLVAPKVNRTFRLVDLDHFTPPWLLSIRGMGHTMGNLRNDSKLDISEPNIRFRACAPGQRTYQVAVFSNPGDTCIAFRILPPTDAAVDENAPLSKAGMDSSVPFRAYPPQGNIEPHQFHLIMLEFAPTIARNEIAFVGTFPVIVDYNESQPRNLRVAGRCWEPKLSFCKGRSIVTFPPTCSGIVSSTTVEIQNVSEIPVLYECKIPSRKRKQFWFPQPGGRLAPSECFDAVVEFCPPTEDTFVAPMSCLSKCIQDPEDIVCGPLRALLPPVSSFDRTPSYVLQFVGHGKGPALLLDPESLDLGAVRACDETKNTLTIINCSQLKVHFTVDCQFIGTDRQAAAVATQALKLDCKEGSIGGRCTETIKIIFTPPCRGLFEYNIMIIPQGSDSRGSRGVGFQLRADVQYPFVQIADLRTESATLLPQSMMWTQFQVDGINSLYQGEVEEVELRFQAAIGIDEKKRLVKALKPFQLLFGTAAAGSIDTIVYLSVCNPSRLKVRFSFQTQKNMGLENVPYWCDEKALVDNREAHFTWVEEHGIYDIEPRSGEILPGDFLHIKMTYHHHSVGTHILPVVFNVHNGRSVLFYLKAHSVPPKVGRLSARAPVVQLEAVPLGVDRGPIQPVELTNSGAVAAPWRVDVNAISEHCRTYYNFEVLAVTPSEGVLDAQTSTFLHFTFTPLEAKQYNLPICVEMLTRDGRVAEELLFELQCAGYDPAGPPPQIPSAFPPSLPIQTYAPVPGCGAALSIELLDFGCCPQRAFVSRMLVLVNYSAEFVLGFSWNKRSLFRFESEFSIEPSSGELSPGSHCVIVFRMCCCDPLDVSGEVACMLEWTHMSKYGHIEEVREDDCVQKPEYLAFHCSHVHEPMRTGKTLSSDPLRHISVANRLTVSRFRTLMSTAAGQKFLNENLHRTAVLASHIPSITARGGVVEGRPKKKTLAGTHAGLSQAGFTDFDAPTMPESPTSFPLYVRIRAVVADWAVPPERRQEFLLPSPAKRFEDQQVNWSSSRQGREEQAELSQAAAQGSFVVSPDVGVLEHILREIMAEDELGHIIDNILMEDTPLFEQYEDSAPPGEREVSALRFPIGAFDTGLPCDVSGGVVEGDTYEAGPVDFVTATARTQRLCTTPLDFPFTFDDGNTALEAYVASSSLDSGPSSVGSYGARPTSANSARGSGSVGEASVDPEVGGDAPESYWAEALGNYGAVDLGIFRQAAGTVLDKMLQDMLEEVVAGRLNWMRPLPRPRSRR